MKLTFEQIKMISEGSVQVQQEENAIHFYRFTPSQSEAFRSIETFQYDLSLATAGCRLEFETDSESIAFCAASAGKYEVLVNGLLCGFWNCEADKPYHLELGHGMKDVTLLLPNHTQGTLSWLELDDGCFVKPRTNRKRILFLGDSITQGWESRYESMSYVNQVATHYDAQILNLGVGGSCMEAFTLEDVGFQPDLVLIAYGTNDYGFCPTLELFRKKCRKYLQTVMALFSTSRILCISPTWRADGWYVIQAGTIDDFRKALCEEADSLGVDVIDGYTLVPHLPEFFSDSVLHPNDLGFSLYARNLIREIDKRNAL